MPRFRSGKQGTGQPPASADAVAVIVAALVSPAAHVAVVAVASPPAMLGLPLLTANVESEGGQSAGVGGGAAGEAQIQASPAGRGLKRRHRRRSSSEGAVRGTPSGGRCARPQIKEQTTPPGVNTDLAQLEGHLSKTFNPDRAGTTSGRGAIKRTLVQAKKFAKWVVANRKAVASLRELVELGAESWICDLWMDFANTELRGRLRLQ